MTPDPGDRCTCGHLRSAHRYTAASIIDYVARSAIINAACDDCWFQKRLVCPVFQFASPASIDPPTATGDTVKATEERACFATQELTLSAVANAIAAANAVRPWRALRVDAVFRDELPRGQILIVRSARQDLDYLVVVHTMDVIALGALSEEVAILNGIDVPTDELLQMVAWLALSDRH